MSRFVESLKRLYRAGNVTAEKMEELESGGKITEEELNYITA